MRILRKEAGRAVELKCPGHEKRLGMVTGEGLRLWCKAGCHEVVISWAELERMRSEGTRAEG